MPFEFKRLKINDLILITPQIFKDERGFFLETYVKSDFKKNGIEDEFTQNNSSFSKKGVIRGLHYQIKPYAQSKIISCTKGTILDIALDVRKDSKTFLKYCAVELNDNNKHMLYIPKGFAHGFSVLSDEAEISYKVSGQYTIEYERGIFYRDSSLNIDWRVQNPILSTKDKNLPEIKDIKSEDLL